MAAKTVENKVEGDKCILSTYPSKLLAKNLGCENCSGYKQNCFAYIPKSVYTKQNQSMAESLQK
jgi:hypothetical protein